MPHIRTNITHVHWASQTYLPSLINQQPSTNLQRNELNLPNSFCTFTKALSQILAFLEETQALTDKNLDVALMAQIKGFEKIGLIEENDDTDYIGFLPTEK
jgi:hypothetical protein